MYGLRRFGIKLELSTIQGILNGLENPQNRMACIHVAGTNGKGSVASALASILRLAGYSVGLYTSPHLVKFNERICINGRPISDENVVLSYEAVKSVRHGGREPTFFEFSTAMALYEFGRQKVEWAVIETGMGGRLDATNIIKPALAVITNISVEHKMYLGNTITQIAAEKGGIIKKYTPVVTGVKQKSVISVLKTIAGSQSAPFYRFGDAFRVRRNRNGTFNYYGIEHIWPNLQTGLMGRYQVDNAAIVLAACEVLNKTRTDLPLETIKDGLMQNRWPGRLEVVSRSPLVILDGAHNFNAARNLARFLSENLAGRNITLVVGILDDKPYKAMLKSLLPFCSRAILTAPKIDRALPPETLLAVAQQIVAETTIVPDVDSAVQHAVETASPDDVICIAGSLYVVGEAKEALGKKDSPINKKLQALGA
ncbi:MAG: bifunctional folylpolyglutamate synthase/dihydrofolate synthase [Desulfobacterales bacterium]|uniref:Dihydrofolate synthase/folylpolyglutamate synthase n=1 Tax=Candidatus Desulfatibia profunda TaxID=2841695 RepID=A0A8J6TH94_9BACT|nr:bifunctional folylpolyglutamate synthase/dihydrofolate synthase [Candidatus Desulfatibia profunda]MBL7180064.1 bifunctional folylpolyglutamate synthase/dihydrofolate synthase [Desulfobacterales bacterium]